MGSRLFPVFIVAGLLLVLASFSLFSVNETESAIRTEFGAIVGTRYTPGLHAKWPWDMVTKFDRRILSQSYTGETFLTNDGRGLIVDFYVKWRVKEPGLYFIATGGREDLAGVVNFDLRSRGRNGEGEIRAHKAACKHRDDWSH